MTDVTTFLMNIHPFIIFQHLIYTAISHTKSIGAIYLLQPVTKFDIIQSHGSYLFCFLKSSFYIPLGGDAMGMLFTAVPSNATRLIIH